LLQYIDLQHEIGARSPSKRDLEAFLTPRLPALSPCYAPKQGVFFPVIYTFHIRSIFSQAIEEKHIFRVSGAARLPPSP
jgi:hypothetical protein